MDFGFKVDELSLLRMKFVQQIHLYLQRLAIMSRSWSVTDPRDRLFSLLGMTVVGNMQPDYTNSPEASYSQFAWDGIATYGNLAISSAVVDNDRGKLRLPS